jgi:hypothetical protein
LCFVAILQKVRCGLFYPSNLDPNFGSGQFVDNMVAGRLELERALAAGPDFTAKESGNLEC